MITPNTFAELSFVEQLSVSGPNYGITTVCWAKNDKDLSLKIYKKQGYQQNLGLQWLCFID